MDVTVSINQGRIEVRQARRDNVERFDNEPEAVSYLLYHVAQMGRRVHYDESCHRPALHGFPGFSVTVLQRMLRNEVAKFGQGMAFGTLAA